MSGEFAPILGFQSRRETYSHTKFTVTLKRKWRLATTRGKSMGSLRTIDTVYTNKMPVEIATVKVGAHNCRVRLALELNEPSRIGVMALGDSDRARGRILHAAFATLEALHFK